MTVGAMIGNAIGGEQKGQIGAVVGTLIGAGITIAW